jgi:hypothetical protein
MPSEVNEPIDENEDKSKKLKYADGAIQENQHPNMEMIVSERFQ